MDKETKNFLEKNIVLGLLPKNISEIDNNFYDRTHQDIEKIVYYVYKNDYPLYVKVTRLIDSLSLGGLWRGRSYAFIFILRSLINTYNQAMIEDRKEVIKEAMRH